MKKISPDLYNLIKSLTKAEKSYFKKYSRVYTSGETAYLKLFDAIEKQVKRGKGYDEEALKKSFEDEKFINQLSVAKNFLHSLILKNLAQFSLDETDNSKLHEMIEGIEVLFLKALFDQSEKLTKKAKKLAYSSENYLKLYELLQWDKNHLLEGASGNLFEKMTEIYEEEIKALEILRESSKIRSIYGKTAAILFKVGYARDSEGIRRFDKLLQEPIMQDVDKLSTFHNKTFFYDIYVAYYSYVRDFENYYKYIKENVQLFEANPQEIKRRQGNYILLIHNQLSGCLYLKRFDEYREVFDKYRTYRKGLGKKLSSYDDMLDVLVRKHELIYFNATGEFSEGVKFIDSYVQELEALGDTYDERELYFAYYFCCLIYYGAGEYNEALNYANKIVNSGELEQRKELYLSAKLMSVLIHYELGNQEYLDPLVRSTYRYLRSRKIEYKFEKFLIGFFRKVLGKVTKEELMQLFDESRYEVGKLMKDPYEVSGLLSFDFEAWLESKLEKKDFSDIVRGKAALN